MSLFGDINVFPSVFSQEDFEKINKFSEKDRWGIQNSSPEFMDKKFLMMKLSDRYFTQTLLNHIKEVFIGNHYELERVYFNGQFFGMPGAPHVDSDEPNRFTFLVYMNRSWDILWGGQTVFCNRYVNVETKQTIVVDKTTQSYYPTPNLGLFFQSNLYHFAESPTKDCPEMRLTLAFKLVNTLVA